MQFNVCMKVGSLLGYQCDLGCNVREACTTLLLYLLSMHIKLHVQAFFSISIYRASDIPVYLTSLSITFQ
jgi:hypothetical protein